MWGWLRSRICRHEEGMVTLGKRIDSSLAEIRRLRSDLLESILEVDNLKDAIEKQLKRMRDRRADGTFGVEPELSAETEDFPKGTMQLPGKHPMSDRYQKMRGKRAG